MTVRQRKPIRVKNYDYSRNGVYYITICSVDRKEIFGELKNNVGAGLASARKNIELSKIGEIVNNQWNDIPNKYSHVKLDKYIIMPNHIHGILVIDNNGIDKREDARPSPTISDIICSFKLKCAVEYLQYIKDNNLDVSGRIWQRGYYDKIICGDTSLERIRKYISRNTLAWQDDEDNLSQVADS